MIEIMYYSITFKNILVISGIQNLDQFFSEKVATNFTKY